MTHKQRSRFMLAVSARTNESWRSESIISSKNKDHRNPELQKTVAFVFISITGTVSAIKQQNLLLLTTFLNLLR